MEKSIAIETLELIAKNHSETWSRDIALKGLMNIVIKKYDIKSGDSISLFSANSADNTIRGDISGVLDGGLLVDLGHVIVDIRDYKTIVSVNDKTIIL